MVGLLILWVMLFYSRIRILLLRSYEIFLRHYSIFYILAANAACVSKKSLNFIDSFNACFYVYAFQYERDTGMAELYLGSFS